MRARKTAVRALLPSPAVQPSRFSYDLPPELIAQHPAEPRDSARLLQLERRSGALADRSVRDLPQLLRPGDLLVCNDTRVIPARLYGQKQSGGKVEILVERVLDERVCLAQLRASKPVRAGTRVRVDGGAGVTVTERDGEFWRLELDAGAGWFELLEQHGHVPLPPYIRRADAAADRVAYQTMFARRPGAVAAPTAGLHFTPALLAAVRARGVQVEFLTLHVGAGTFQPVRAAAIEDHLMHAERFEVSADLCARVAATHAAGGRVVAAGTTTVRALESAAAAGGLQAQAGETRLFIRPGFEFRVVDAMLTNFHLPQSTLLMLVAAFAGTERVLAAYAHAVRQRYRFYSYGDAMFIA